MLLVMWSAVRMPSRPKNNLVIWKAFARGGSKATKTNFYVLYLPRNKISQIFYLFFRILSTDTGIHYALVKTPVFFKSAQQRHIVITSVLCFSNVPEKAYCMCVYLMSRTCRQKTKKNNSVAMKVPCSVRREQIICNLQNTLFKSKTNKQSFYLKSICHRRLKGYEY